MTACTSRASVLFVHERFVAICSEDERAKRVRENHQTVLLGPTRQGDIFIACNILGRTNGDIAMSLDGAFSDMVTKTY